MKKLIPVILLFINHYCLAQHIEYKYDLAGNRVERKYYLARIANPALAIDSSDIVERKPGITVYPNPVSEKINIGIANLEDGESALIY